MIHSGAIVGAGIPQFQSITFKKLNFNFPYFRSDRDKRDFVSGGAAAGVAGNINCPEYSNLSPSKVMNIDRVIETNKI